MAKVFKGINIILSIGLVFIAAGVAYVTIPYFGNQALIVRSGSMEPAIGVGSIVVARGGDELISPSALTPKYNAGDIIAFRSEKNPKTIITHRAVSVEVNENGVSYKTKGDANEEPDNWTVDEKNILGKTYFILPYAGRLLTFAKSKVGFSSLIIFPAVLVILMEMLNIIKHIKNAKKSNQIREDDFSLTPSAHTPSTPSVELRTSPLRASGLGSTGLKVVVSLLAVGLIIPIAVALQSDTETSAHNVFQASDVFPTATSSATLTPTGAP